MARVHPFQTNFTAGEFTPKLTGQVAFKKYANAVETLQNMTVFPQGGATRRSGTRFAAEVADSTKTTRLIPFEFNVTQSYVLEFGHRTMRVFKDNGQVTLANKTITAITKASPAVVTAASHGYSNGDHVWISGVVGMTEVNGRRYAVAGVTTHTFQLSGVNSSDYTTYSSAGVAAKVFELTTLYDDDQVFDIKFVQSADTMYIVHPEHEPMKLTRTGHSVWSIDEVVFEKGPYLDANTTATTLTPGATSGDNRTLVASADLFASTDVGRLVTFNSGHGKIDAFTDAQNVRMDITTNFTNTDAKADWQQIE